MRGDFIQRNLDETFVTFWDGWLQRVMGSSKATLGSRWLEYYLVSPVWRFALGQPTAQQHAGVMLPSVDKVGRYFPFTIAMRLANDVPLTEFITHNQAWYEQAETLAMQALDEQLDYEQLNQAVENLGLVNLTDSSPDPLQRSKAFKVDLSRLCPLETGLSRIQTRFCQPPDQLLSYWWNTEEDGQSGDLLGCLGMPDDSAYLAMLVKNWELGGISNLDGR